MQGQLQLQLRNWHWLLVICDKLSCGARGTSKRARAVQIQTFSDLLVVVYLASISASPSGSSAVGHVCICSIYTVVDALLG